MTIRASQPGDGNYAAAANVERSFLVKSETANPPPAITVPPDITVNAASATTSAIQKPCAPMAGTGRQGSQAGARPSTQPSGSERPQNAATWISIGGRVVNNLEPAERDGREAAGAVLLVELAEERHDGLLVADPRCRMYRSPGNDIKGAGRLTLNYMTDPEGNIVELQRWHW